MTPHSSHVISDCLAESLGGGGGEGEDGGWEGAGGGGIGGVGAEEERAGVGPGGEVQRRGDACGARGSVGWLGVGCLGVCSRAFCKPIRQVQSGFGLGFGL